jgi:putative transcriptional regulator
MALTGGLAPGFLLASPQLGDPNFERTVVLLGHHDVEGALGWVINGKPLVPVRQLLRDANLVPNGVTLPETEAFSTVVRVGGPVMPGSAWLVYWRDERAISYAGEHDLGGGVAVTGAREAVEAVARGEGPRQFRMFLGYAGWGPEQVEGEIRAGAWLPSSFDPSLIALGAEEIWAVGYKQAVGTVPMAFTGSRRGQA